MVETSIHHHAPSWLPERPVVRDSKFDVRPTPQTSMVREEDALEAFTEISEGGDEATPEMQGAASILAAHISVRPPHARCPQPPSACAPESVR